MMPGGCAVGVNKRHFRQRYLIEELPSNWRGRRCHGIPFFMMEVEVSLNE